NAPNGTGRTPTKIIQFRRDGTVAGRCATCGIGDPVLAVAIDGADRALAHDEGTDIALRLGNILLDVVDMVRVRAERLLVFQHRLRRVAVIDASQQTPPRTGYGLEHGG